MAIYQAGAGMRFYIGCIKGLHRAGFKFGRARRLVRDEIGSLDFALQRPGKACLRATTIANVDHHRDRWPDQLCQMCLLGRPVSFGQFA